MQWLAPKSARGLVDLTQDGTYALDMKNPEAHEAYEALLTPPEAAEFLSISRSVLARYRMDGTGPRFIRLSPKQQGQVRYRRSDLEKWLDARTYQSTSEEVAS